MMKAIKYTLVGIRHRLIFQLFLVFCLTANVLSASESLLSLNHNWEVNPSDFEFSMTLIAEMDAAAFSTNQEFHELGVFVGTELRGVAQLTPIESLDRDLFFLTIYANQVGEELSFEVYDSVQHAYIRLAENILFTPDIHLGSISDPVLFSPLNPTKISDLESIQLKVFPNPFDQVLNIESASEGKDRQVGIFHVSGQVILDKMSIRNKELERINTSNWIPGLYIIQIREEDKIVNHPILKQP